MKLFDHINDSDSWIFYDYLSESLKDHVDLGDISWLDAEYWFQDAFENELKISFDDIHIDHKTSRLPKIIISGLSRKHYQELQQESSDTWMLVERELIAELDAKFGDPQFKPEYLEPSILAKHLELQKPGLAKSQYELVASFIIKNIADWDKFFGRKDDEVAEKITRYFKTRPDVYWVEAHETLDKNNEIAPKDSESLLSMTEYIFDNNSAETELELG